MEKSFSLSQDEFLFDLLRKKIYGNPFKAAIKEVASNARDANIEAGNHDKPIQISITSITSPSGSLSLIIKIKDFGLGISPDRMDIFTVYGESTKRNDSSQVGGFGLGCKSPFAVCDSFSINTVNDGIMYEYLAYLDGGAGKISLNSSSKSDEPSGTEIVFSVSNKSFYDLNNIINELFLYWEVKPIILIDENQFKITSNDNFYFDDIILSKSPVIVVDGFSYYLGQDIFNKIIKNCDVFKQFQNLHNKFVYCPIYLSKGDIDLHPSRETYSLNDGSFDKMVESANLSYNKISYAIKNYYSGDLEDKISFASKLINNCIKDNNNIHLHLINFSNLLINNSDDFTLANDSSSFIFYDGKKYCGRSKYIWNSYDSKKTNITYVPISHLNFNKKFIKKIKDKFNYSDVCFISLGYKSFFNDIVSDIENLIPIEEEKNKKTINTFHQLGKGCLFRVNYRDIGFGHFFINKDEVNCGAYKLISRINKKVFTASSPEGINKLIAKGFKHYLHAVREHINCVKEVEYKEFNILSSKSKIRNILNKEIEEAGLSYSFDFIYSDIRKPHGFNKLSSYINELNISLSFLLPERTNNFIESTYDNYNVIDSLNYFVGKDDEVGTIAKEILETYDEFKKLEPNFDFELIRNEIKSLVGNLKKYKLLNSTYYKLKHDSSIQDVIKYEIALND